MSFTVPTELTLSDDQFCLTFNIPEPYDQWKAAMDIVYAIQDRIRDYQKEKKFGFYHQSFSNGQYDGTIIHRSKYDTKGKKIPEGMSVAEFRIHDVHG